MLKLGTIFLLYLIITTVYTAPSSDFVVTTDGPSGIVGTTEESSPKDDAPYPKIPKIYEMKVESNVSNRFATTLVSSRVKNYAKEAQEATFSVVLPETAYISGFVMEVGGKSYKAYVREKEEARQIYDVAVESGQGAAHVEANARDSRRFTISVNIEPESKATFKLSYEELLQRENGQYEIVINIHPGQPVNNLEVTVNINETRPLKFLKIPPLRSGNDISKSDKIDTKLDTNAVINKINENNHIIKFNPDEEKQKQFAGTLGTPEDNGLAGQFIVQYDVIREPQGGEVLVNDGYFVHFFAPDDREPLPKHVVFVLDTSGSMGGIRITQLKEAMNSILNELKADDVFNIVEFNSVVKVWNIPNVEVAYQQGKDPWSYYPDNNGEVVPDDNKNQTLPEAFPVNDLNKGNAEKVVQKLDAFGGTNIKSALDVGLKLIKKNSEHDNKHQSLIIFLTDGEPTVGETNTDKIISEIQKLNEALGCPIFSLSLGDGADRDFLQKLSLKNNGFARHIYESADASLQLEEFYKTISSPILSNVTFKYVSNVTKLTKTIFPIFFHGSEIIVAGIGEIDPGFSPVTIHSWSKRGPIDLTPKVEKITGSLERLWAYLTIKQILEARETAEEKNLYTRKALDLALKYSFVTPVSSLVVVKPNDTKPVDTEDASKSSNADRPYYMRGIAVPPPSSPVAGYAPLSLGSQKASMGGSVENAATNFFYPMAVSYDSVDLVYAVTTSVATTETTTIATTSVAAISLQKLKAALPWLESILNNDGTTLKLPNGNYKLGANETVSTTPECPKTPANGTAGVCQLLHNCPAVHQFLKDVNDFQKYFCPLEGFAGICCPP